MVVTTDFPHEELRPAKVGWALLFFAVALFLILFTVSGSILFTWLYNNTDGNIFLPALMHATANASLPLVERIVPAIDGEIVYPLLVFFLWGVLAWFVVSRLGLAPIGEEPGEGGAL